MKNGKKRIIAGGLALMGLVISLGTFNVNAAELTLRRRAITESAAKNAALKDAGVSEKDATFIKIHRDYENGVEVFDMEFYVNGTKYSYDISTANGSIVSKEVEKKKIHTPKKTVTPSRKKYIGKSKAKKIALKHAKVSAKKATFEYVKLDWDNGVRVYEVDFYTSTREYNYEINARTGKIVEFSSEPLDDGWDD